MSPYLKQASLTSDFFMLRTPLLPINSFSEWSKDLLAPGTIAEKNMDSVTIALNHDKELLRGRLQSLLEIPAIHEAIFIASPALEASLANWRTRPGSEKAQRTERSLVRYFSRMTNRSTPFGLFAGCSLGTMGNETRLELAQRPSYLRHTRPDMDYVIQLTQQFSENHSTREALTYRPNTSLYQIGNSYRYSEWRNKANGRGEQSREYHLVSVPQTAYLETILERASLGARPSELAPLIVEDGVTIDDARDYINELIDAQFLVSTLEPAGTGDEPTPTIIEHLKRSKSSVDGIRGLSQALGVLADLDLRGVGNPPSAYRELAADLAKLAVPVDLSKFLQVDMIKPVVQATIGQSVHDELEKLINVIHRICPASDSAPLKRFIDAFTSRFESQWIPLADALDEEGGLGRTLSEVDGGEDSPLLRGLNIGKFIQAPVRQWSDSEVYLSSLIDKIDPACNTVLHLSDADIDRLLSKNTYPLPDSFGLIFSIIAKSSEAVNVGDFSLLLGGVMGPSAGRLFGRFCHSDPALLLKLKEHLKSEEARCPEAIFAEIVHLPQGRSGNVIIRPLLRDYEIPFLGGSGAPISNQIPLSDLLVTVIANRIVLKSKRLNKEIIPRMSNAHNFNARGLMPYRFLCLLQGQGVVGGGWSWGHLQGRSFLPRVQYQKGIFSLARWTISVSSLKNAISGAPCDRYASIQSLRKITHLPRFVNLVDGDNKLLVDFDNILSIDSFLAVVKNRQSIQLEEDYPSFEESPVVGPEGNFCHEILMAFTQARRPTVLGSSKNQVTSTTMTQRLRPIDHEEVQRTFLPGSNWLYLKIYCGWSTADHVLSESIGPLLTQLGVSELIDKWFFIRYRDNDLHLRLRIHGDPVILSSQVMPRLKKELVKFQGNGAVWKLQIDTYVRELERYGGSYAIGHAETIFHADSLAVTKLLELYKGDGGLDCRWMLALAGVDCYLTDFGMSLWEKRAWAERAKRSFMDEFQTSGISSHRIGDRFRHNKLLLIRLIEKTTVESDSAFIPGLNLLSERSVTIIPAIQMYQRIENEGRLSSNLGTIIQSFAHMFINRILRTEQRAHEAIIYDFLFRVYDSTIARHHPKMTGPKRT